MKVQVQIPAGKAIVEPQVVEAEVPDPFDPAPLIARIDGLEKRITALEKPAARVYNVRTPLGNVQKHPRSDALMAEFKRLKKAPYINIKEYTVMIYEPDTSVSKIPLILVNRDGSVKIDALSRYLADGVRIQAHYVGSPGLDGGIAILQPDGVNIDGYKFKWVNGEPRVVNAGISTRENNICRTIEGIKTGSRASGIASHAGIIMRKDLANGVIPYAPAICVAPEMLRQGEYDWPATKTDGSGNTGGPDALRMGMILQVRPTFSIPSGIPPMVAMLIKAAQTFGMPIPDRAGSLGSGTVAFAAEWASTNAPYLPYWGGKTAGGDIAKMFWDLVTDYVDVVIP